LIASSSRTRGRTCGLALAIAVATAAAIVAHAPRVHAEAEDDLRDGDKYFDQGDWKKAATAYDRAIGKAPSQVSAAAYGKRAAIFIIQKDYQGGLEFVARAKSRYPNAAEVLEQEALLLWETGKRDEAIAIAEKVVKTRPQSFANQKIIGEYYSARDPLKTAAAFEAYIAHRPAELESGDVLPRIQLGFAYLTNARAVLGDGDEVHAEQLYTKAVDQFEYVSRKLGKKPNAQVNADNGLCAAYTGLRKWDQAVTVCERIIRKPKQIDTTGSVWFNLATAYLANKQTRKARNAANEFTRVRKGEARGYILIGDTFFADGDWSNALDQYNRAEKLLKPNQTRDEVQLSIRLGKTYRRLPYSGRGDNPNLKLAIDKLSRAWNANPSSLELATELGAAYLDAKLDAKATALTDKVLARPELGKAPATQRAAVLVLGGKSLFNQHKLREARQRFEAARGLEPADIPIQRALISTINEQALEVSARDVKSARVLLDQALAIDASSTTTLTNIAVLAIEHDDCAVAQRQLQKLKDVRGSDTVLTLRLLARSYLCGSGSNVKKATEAFAAAEREAKKANAQLALAEIYAEWGPLLWDTDLDGAVAKLELAVNVSSQDPDVAPAAKRNLALALYRRGWRAMHDGKSSEAAADFERATRDPSVLKGSEQLAFDFSYAAALLDTGRSGEAAKIFKQLAARGNQGTYLRGPYARAGSQFFSAYASYRNATGSARASACNELARHETELGGKVKELVASCWEYVAVDEWRAGSNGAAQRAISTAEKTATGDQKRRLTMDRAALALDKNRVGELEALNGNPPESLVDLGIVYDLLGKPKQAYDAWQKAKARGVNAKDLQKWIDAKKRIYGF
jgi:tetratricopeptide (TPR) repeat protein